MIKTTLLFLVEVGIVPWPHSIDNVTHAEVVKYSNSQRDFELGMEAVPKMLLQFRELEDNVKEVAHELLIPEAGELEGLRKIVRFLRGEKLNLNSTQQKVRDVLERFVQSMGSKQHSFDLVMLEVISVCERKQARVCPIKTAFGRSKKQIPQLEESVFREETMGNRVRTISKETRKRRLIIVAGITYLAPL